MALWFAYNTRTDWMPAQRKGASAVYDLNNNNNNNNSNNSNNNNSKHTGRQTGRY
jgi:hypothetical protein